MQLPAAILALAAACARMLGWLLAVLFAVLTLDVLWGVFSRYVLGAQSRWTEEVAIYLLIWVSLLGAAWTYRERGHLGFDYVMAKLDPQARRAGAIAVELIVAGFVVFVFIYGGGSLMARSLSFGQVTPALGWQVGWFYSVIPLSGLFFLLFSAEHLIGHLRGNGEEAGHDD